MKRILITGAIGFIGSHFVEHILKETDWEIIALCRCNTAGDYRRLLDQDVMKNEGKRVNIVFGDLRNAVNAGLSDSIGSVDYIVHFAANSHVDRSITHPVEFVYDNVVGTANLLEWYRITNPGARFINFSTDEVFGPAPDNYNFTENDRFRPSNPYSASKAGQTCLGHAYFTTYGLDIINTFTMNVFGERQNPEKLVPLVMQKIMKGEPVPIHSKLEGGEVAEVGQRHWLHARNAADAILFLLRNGVKGEWYNVVGDTELHNDVMAKKIAEVMGKEVKLEYVDFHKCRPGHDRRYALDGSKIAALGWNAPLTFDESLKRTVDWTMAHKEWLK